MDEQRLESLRPVAAQLGWTLTTAPFPREGAVADIIRTLNMAFQFPRVRNVLHGRKGDAEASVFDFSHVISKYSRASRTAVCFRSGELKLPPFSLTDLGLGKAKTWNAPRGFGAHAMLSAFYQNYRVTQLVYLSGGFRRMGKKEQELIRAFLTPSIESFYEARGGSGGLGTIGLGEHLVYFGYNQMVAPQEIPAFLNEAQEAFELFKAASRRTPIPDATLNEWLAQVKKAQASRKGCLLAAFLLMPISTTVFLAIAYAGYPITGLILFPVIMFVYVIITLLYYKLKGLQAKG